MKKLLLPLLFAAFLIAPASAYATPVSLDFNPGTNILQPLQTGWSALFKADHFQATSTTASSTLPLIESTQLKIRTLSGLLKGATGYVTTATAGTDYQAPITLTTTGTSGAATFVANTLNVPQYAGTTYTATYPITLTGSAFGTAFSTTTANTFNNTNTFAASQLNVTGLSNGCLQIASNLLTSTGSACGSGSGGITAIGPAGQTQTGSTITFATSTAAFNGLTSNVTITGSGDTLTFAPTLSGTLGVGGGGTGRATFTSSQLLYGNGTNALSSVATSSLAVGTGLVSSGTLGAQVGGTASSVSFAAINANSLWANMTGASAVPTNIATTSLFAGTGGQVLGFINGGWTGVGTTTAGTGLTYNAGSPGNFSVNTSQNIATLSNLTGNGFVKTSGGTGALSIDTNTYLTSAVQQITVPQGNFSGNLTFATTSNTTNGITSKLMITGSGSTLTFGSDQTGTLTVPGGGTGVGTFTSSQLLYGNGTNALSSVATTTLTGTAPITFSQPISVIGATPSVITCATATGSVPGCLSAADWTTFNGKLSAAITSIGPTGQTSTGPAITLATTTSTTNGETSAITITGSGSTMTFTPSQSGTRTVAGGGTGVATLTAYAPVFGGTTGTGAVQSGTVGNSGEVLTSNGAGALPTFQAAAGGSTVTRGRVQSNGGSAMSTAISVVAGDTIMFWVQAFGGTDNFGNQTCNSSNNLQLDSNYKQSTYAATTTQSSVTTAQSVSNRMCGLSGIGFFTATTTETVYVQGNVSNGSMGSSPQSTTQVMWQKIH